MEKPEVKTDLYPYEGTLNEKFNLLKRMFLKECGKSKRCEES